MPMALQFNPLIPIWLLLILAAMLLTAIGYGAVMMLQKQIARPLVQLLSALRLGVFFVFVCILLQPIASCSTSVPQLPEMIVLLDTSQSMAQPAQSQTRIEESLAHLRKGDLAQS